jgi:hypothetical protein
MEPVRRCSTLFMLVTAGPLLACSGANAPALLGYDGGGAADGPSADGPSADGASAASSAQIVYANAAASSAGGQNIVTMNLDGSGSTQITHDALNGFLPHFSPDATRLLYWKTQVAADGGAGAHDVVVYDFAAAKETQLTSIGTVSQPIWSPDGKRIAFGNASTSTPMGSLWVMSSDGSDAHQIGAPSGSLDDKVWGDPAWSSDDWILFVVAQFDNGCFKTRLDKIRPDGTARTKVTDGGPNCTPSGFEQSGDADPGFSADGKTIYSSRGLPVALPVDAGPGLRGRTLRHLFSFSSDPWTEGKVETDLSLASAPDCIAGVPKGSPDGKQVLLYLDCPAGTQHGINGVTLTDTTGSNWTFVTTGFGPDWNPVAK